jgi:hypothetical protein
LQSPIVYFPYFITGSIAASVIETMHNALWRWRSHQSTRRASSLPPTFYSKHTTTATCTGIGGSFSDLALKFWEFNCRATPLAQRLENRAIAYLKSSLGLPQKVLDYMNRAGFWPHLMTDSSMEPQASSTNAISDQLANSLRVINVNDNDTATSTAAAATTANISHPMMTCFDSMKGLPIPTKAIFIALHVLWRFFPDAVFIVAAYLLIPQKSLVVEPVKTFLWSLIIPTIFIAQWVVLLLQKGDSRRNLSRFFLQTFPFTTLGYCSYALLIIQAVALRFYAPFFYFKIYENDPETPLRKRMSHVPFDWFRFLPVPQKIAGFLVVYVVCYILQKYFQDKLVVYVYTKALAYFSDRSKNSKGQNKQQQQQQSRRRRSDAPVTIASH